MADVVGLGGDLKSEVDIPSSDRHPDDMHHSWRTASGVRHGSNARSVSGYVGYHRVRVPLTHRSRRSLLHEHLGTRDVRNFAEPRTLSPHPFEAPERSYERIIWIKRYQGKDPDAADAYGMGM